tara:strand:+ start:2553 stop:2672 length:120 start_codon:yes stop_codon:yes gene_type:complete
MGLGSEEGLQPRSQHTWDSGKSGVLGGSDQIKKKKLLSE